ncbi:MAG: hypothetical protein GTO45_13560 [Candidatus Aminicenantes bacterium]|nr:hypothetical protein [Candidatus Aminicenantes bacterium]NIM79803.1 hypothetical protein [Candidatus Aminicenantes bacterium]NIN19133.1 hypothetical protein [Candidatus Aminicenantes bacterium]NIN43037.1 hypothetical protein [Candidatus Aminicenantes bacterium]NIN85778.1 hypothetical protein [Candidatus Aminicenantes bacterium]
MRNQRGKANISAIIVMLLIFYGGFVAFKFISTRITKGQIKNDVINRFGFVRGPDFTERQGRNIIREILAQHNIIPEAKPEAEDDEYYEEETDVGVEDAGSQAEGTEEAEGTGDTKSTEDKTLIIWVKLDEKKRNIKFHIRYEVVIDLILFKSKQVYDIQEQMRNYT